MMAGNGMEKIPTPLRLYWQRFRYTTLPLIGLCAFAACTLLLWTKQGEMPHAIGEIEAIRAEVSSPLAGILVPLPKQEAWALYETVEANQPLAQLDDQPLKAELAAFQQELDRIEKELGAVKAKLDVSEADRKLTYASDAARLWVELEQHGLIALERQAEVAVNAIEAQRRTVYFDCLKPLYDKKIVSELELNNARYLRDEAKKRLTENTKVAGQADFQKAASQTRLDKMGKFLPADIEKELAPIIQAAKVQEAKIEEVKVQIGRLTIRSPIHGMIAAINHWPGSAIKAGDPILTIASDERRYIVCYVRQEQHVEPHVAHGGRRAQAGSRRADRAFPGRTCRGTDRVDPHPPGPRSQVSRVGPARSHRLAGEVCRSSRRAFRGDLQDALERRWRRPAGQ